jgi:D-serine deaminase-like pyridoxal phosphate-dependent protein
MKNEFPTPAVIVDLNIVEKNIREMIQNNLKYGINHRPHIKSHRSSMLAKMQIENGAIGVTCAKLGEAEVMAEKGINNILVAYPLIGEDKWNRCANLSKKCKLTTIVNSVYGAEGLSKAFETHEKPMDVLIELDGGTKRGGITPGEDALEFANSISHLKGIKIIGLMYYPGLIYNEHTKEGKEKFARKEHDDLIETAELLRKNGFLMEILSGGNTVSSKVPMYLEGITEVRAGNYIFNDCAQLNYNEVRIEECALRIEATVISVVDDFSAIIDAGTKTLSSDFFPSSGNKFGYVIGHEDIEIFKLNEEHGFLKSDEPIGLSVGDRIMIIPNHACVVPNLVDEMYGVRGNEFITMIPIDARGKSV